MRKRLYLVCFLSLGLGLVAGCQKSGQTPALESQKALKPYEAMDFARLKGMEGFSDVLLQNHFALYQGYVKNTNLMLDQLRGLLKSEKTNSLEYSELKRRAGFEFNGMRLHEYYFGNLGGKKGLEPASDLYRAIVDSFGSYELWKKDFAATGAMRGIGWVILYVDAQTGRLINFWINEHEVNHPAGCKPLLVMDVWEHAYMLDYQLERAKYIEAFFKNILWDEVAKRYKFATLPTVENLPAMRDTSSESLKMFQKQPES